MSRWAYEIAQQTEAAVAAGGYRTAAGRSVDIGEAVRLARAGTRMYRPGDAVPAAPVQSRATGGAGALEVTAESSLEAARRLATGGGPAGAAGQLPVGVLNFASARNPGGGYLYGAEAQEEALCRGSALHTCLSAVPEFYAEHRKDRSPFYSDRVIHSPGVPVFRDDEGGWLDEPYRAAFLTCAAPNAGVIAGRWPERSAEVPDVLHRRAERVLEVAAAHGHRSLVLGAWGCGVFRNRPREVAAAFAAALGPGGRFAGAFEQVVFAILDRRQPSPVRAEFEDLLGRPE